MKRLFALTALVLVGAVISGCSDQRIAAPAASPTPDFLIADASHSWNPAFHWLPPVDPNYAPTGVFDPSRSPVARICEWAGDHCVRQVAEYSRAVGTIVVDTTYRFTWNTADPTLKVPGVYRVYVYVDGREAGFFDAQLVVKGDKGQVDGSQYFKVVVDTSAKGRKGNAGVKIKFRLEIQRQQLDLHIDNKGDGPLGQELGSGTRAYPLTMTNDPSGTFQAIYSDATTAGVYSGERRFARTNPVVRMTYSDNDYFAVWAGRQNPDNSIEGAWLDAAGQTGDFRIVARGVSVDRTSDNGHGLIPSTYKASGAAELDGGWILTFDRFYDGAYVPEPGATNALAFTASGATGLSAVYTDGGSGSFEGALYTARYTSVITLLFTNADYYAAFAGAMTDPNHIVGVYFDAAGYSGDFVLTRRYYEGFDGASLSSGWEARGGSWSVADGQLTGSFSVVNVDPQLTRTNPAGTPTTIRARILNTPGAPLGGAGIVFNWVSSTDYYAIELRTNNPSLSADILRRGPGEATSEILASCPAGLANTDTWYVLELTDTETGLQGRLLDGGGSEALCSMQVSGAHVTNADFGVVAYSGGGLVKVDWIGADSY